MDTILKYKVQEYSKQAAFDKTPIDKVVFKYMKDITVSYHKAGCPSGTDLDIFLNDYMDKKKITSGIITLNNGKRDIKSRPYVLYNNPPIKKRTFQLVYEVVPANIEVSLDKKNHVIIDSVTRIIENQKGDKIGEENFDVQRIDAIATGLPISVVDTMAKAKILMKHAITDTHQDYFIRELKVPLDTTFNQDKVCFGKYSPSKNSYLGTYIFFVKENK